MNMEEMTKFCKQYGFIYSGSEIYGGLANTWDYGPLGSMLKNNIKEAWRIHFIRRNKDAQIIGRSAGNKEIVANSQQNITALTHKYNELSKVSNLPTYKNRLVVSGYRRVNASKLK